MTFEGIAGSTFSHIAIDDVLITCGKCQEQTVLSTASAPAPSSVYPKLHTDKPSFTSILSTVGLPTIKPSLSSSQSIFNSSTIKASLSPKLTTSKATTLSGLSTIKPSLSSSVLSGIANFQFCQKPLYQMFDTLEFKNCLYSLLTSC